MGKEFYDKSPSARELWDEAEDIMGGKLREKVFSGPADELQQTDVTQPAVYITEIMILKEVVKAGLKASGAAGHSLGEYAAAVAAGAMDWQTGLELVKKRGEIFQRESEKNPGGMIAAIGIGENELKEILRGFKGVAEIVNYNCPGQLVVSTEKSIFYDVLEALGKKAKMAVELKVSGAFHSSLMNDAAGEMKKVIEEADIREAQMPFYVNFSAEKASGADEVKNALARQVNSPVRWIGIVDNISRDLEGPEFYEIGPGNTLRGILRRIDRKLKVKNIAKPSDLENS